jgi:hypothetical protein
MSKTICELKMELKAKGIKGYSGLNKAGLESLLKGVSEAKTAPPPVSKKDKSLNNKAKGFLNKMDKEFPKPKPFKPVPTKGESPTLADKPINKKIKIKKMYT